MKDRVTLQNNLIKEKNQIKVKVKVNNSQPDVLTSVRNQVIALVKGLRYNGKIDLIPRRLASWLIKVYVNGNKVGVVYIRKSKLQFLKKPPSPYTNKDWKVTKEVAL